MAAMHPKQVYMRDEDWALLEAVAFRRAMSIAALIRLWLAPHLARERRKEETPHAVP